MPARLLILLSFLALSACAGETDDEAGDEVGDDQAAILGGGVERGYPAVGAIILENGAIGSGTLITRDTVLTAAHVASGHPKTFHFGVPPAGKDPRHVNLRVAEVVSVAIHPCYVRHPNDGCPGKPGDPIDVAIVKLKTPITDVAPMPIIDQPLRYLWGLISPWEDDSCAVVGFGANIGPDGKVTIATRRSAHAKIEDVGDTEIVTVRETGIATGGDSGGPLLCSGKIIGVVRGSAGRVPKSQPYERSREAYERIDLHRAWIAARIAGR